MDGNNVSLRKEATLGFNQTSTLTTSGGTIASDSTGYMVLRGSLSYSITSSGFNVEKASIDAYSSNGTWITGYAKGVTLSNVTMTMAAFTSSPSYSTTYPKGYTFLTDQLSTSYQSIVSYKTSNAYIKSSNNLTVNVILRATVKVDDRLGKSTSTVTKSFTATFVLTAPRSVFSLTYIKDDGSQYGSAVTGVWGTSTTIKSGYSKDGYTDTSSGTYTVSFNSNGGTSINPKNYNWSWRQPITFSFSDWGGYKPGATYVFTKDNSLKASFVVGSGDRIWTYSSLGSLPTVSKKGYIKTNEWYYSNGNIASSSDEVKNSFTLSCKWTPQNYKIKFSFDLNGGQMPEDMGKISEYEIFKTYGINSDATKTPNFTPVKLGYKFIGWSDKTKSIPPIGANSSNQGVSVSIPDSFYNAVNTEFTNNDVTLYAYWEYNNNKVDCLYYLTDDENERVNTDHYEYNIDTSTIDPQGDKAFIINGPTSLRSGDYAFLGWVDVKPDNWDKEDKINNGYHGTYAVPPEKILGVEGYLVDIELPVYIKIKNFKNYNDWGGEPEVYYGIWAKTGKYMKINGSWKKVNKCFVKINGLWKIVTDIWTRDDTVTKDANTNEYWPWHHEI